jgi:DNA-binding XRE family transcriptional regulator
MLKFLSYADWLASRDRQENLVPNEVVNLTFDHDWSPMRAWREHLGLTQAEVAARENMTQGAYAKMENSAKPRRATLKKIAKAIGLTAEQLDF